MSRLVRLALLATLLPITIGGSGLVDPTRPPSGDAAFRDARGGEDVRLRVSSIVVAPERRVAVINGHRVGVGSRLGGAEVVEISPDAVRLRDSQGEFELPLYRSPVTKRTVRTE